MKHLPAVPTDGLMPSASSNHATTGPPHFPGGLRPVVASLLVLLLAVYAPERIEDLAVLVLGI